MLLPKIAEIFEITIDRLYGIEYVKSEKQQKKIHKYLEEEMEFLPWENDAIIRVAVFEGKKLLWENEKNNLNEQVQIYLNGEIKDVINYGNIICNEVQGDITSYGALYCNMDINCNNIEGIINSNGDINCEEIHGATSAGGNINCEEIYGNVSAGATVKCENIQGDVSAGISVSCETIAGNTTANKVSEGDSVDMKNKRIYINSQDDEYSKEINKKVQGILESVSQTLDKTAKSILNKNK